MALDLFFRAETPATMRTVVRSAPFRNIMGDVRARDEDGNIVAGLRMLPGSVDHVYFPPNSVSNGAGGTDVWCWLHLRLTGSAEAGDLDDTGPTGPDRWERSRIRAWVRDNGALKTIRGVRVYEHTLASGKNIQVWRGRDMAAQGVLFHEFQGGNSY